MSPGSCPYPQRDGHQHTRRRPEPVEVYELGHYEQMLLAKAVHYAATGGAEADYALTEKEAHDLWGLVHIVSDHLPVTIIRQVSD